MLSRFGKILRTIRYIKPQQALFQVRNRLIKAKAFKHYKCDEQIQLNTHDLDFLPLPSIQQYASPSRSFTFLNLTQTFINEIDWNFQSYGKLWNYNLQYFALINQEGLSEEIRVYWLREFYTKLSLGTVKLEPYPASLRIMNIIRFFSLDKARKTKYVDILINLHAELNWVHSNYEYHLLGNHLLENSFAMLMGSYFFGEKYWENKAFATLEVQLNEQILDDGAHFELSPMYHQIILFRVLEAIDYLPEEAKLFRFLRSKATLMFGWLKQITYSNGDIPHFNDSADGITFTSQELFKLAADLGIDSNEVRLHESGFRKLTNANFELIADVHGISPSYQPGHNHSDHLSFILYFEGKPLIVDPGTSTYNISERRNWERSSMAHNTVTVNNMDQSEVWSGFRVGRRANVKILNESQSEISASAEYKELLHIRNFSISESSILISDKLNVGSLAMARFYLHPDIGIKNNNSKSLTLTNGIKVTFEEIDELCISNYEFSEGFNKLASGICVEASFSGKLITSIRVPKDD